MSIKAVFRVQCDGPCKGWLSLPESYVPGTDFQHVDLVTAPTAERAGDWPGERAARNAALQAGWRTIFRAGDTKGSVIRCPKCYADPYDAARHFPEDRGQVTALIRAQRRDCGHTSPSALGALSCTRPQGHDDEHRNGTLDWF